MYWYGRIIGSLLGLLVGGFVGCIIGFIVGYFFDQGLVNALKHPPLKGIPEEDIQNAQHVFFKTVFLVMGYLAKIDGRVSESEIQVARKIMDKMALTEALRLKAIHYFNQGKSQQFDLNDTLSEFLTVSHGNESLLLMFIEIMLTAVYADGQMSLVQRRALMAIANQLGFSANDMARLEAMYRAQQRFYGHSAHAQQRGTRSLSTKLQDAYEVLGVKPDVSNENLSKAYRRLMSQHHPDKLMSKGLPEDMIKMATEKTQDIKRAYELIRKNRAS